MVEQLLAVIALASSITAGAAVMLATMALLRSTDPGPRDPRPTAPTSEDIH